MELTKLSLTGMRDGLAKGKFSSYDLVKAFKDAYEADNTEAQPINGYIEFFGESLELAKEADQKRSEGDTRPFLGVPVAIKDNILVEGHITSASSKTLEDFVAPYSSTVVNRLKEAGFIMLGRTNMDEFGMGSSTEYTIYGATRNPVDRDRASGGSSGGSSAVVAGYQAPLAFGTDTGGSVRLPSAFTGIYGYKPSYGLLSRYGVIAYASSLDQIGLMSYSPADIAEVMQVIAGRDSADMTSRDYAQDYKIKETSFKGLKVTTLAEFSADLMSEEVRAGFDRFKNFLGEAGAILSEDSVPTVQDSLALYYVISLCEASSNLSRYDGIRYGIRPESTGGVEELYTDFRSKNMGEEVQRRVTLGNYFLSSDASEGRFYDKAEEVLDQLKASFKALFERVDFLLVPTSFAPAFKLGEKNDNPLQMYLTDLGTIFVNLVGLPAISLPAHETGLPVGVQLIGRMGSDTELLSLAQAWEKGRN